MTVDDLVEGFIDEANISYIDFYYIVAGVKDNLGKQEPNEVLEVSLTVARKLIDNCVFPGNYTLEGLQREGFSYWHGTPDQMIDRIKASWIALKRPLDYDDICWFALKPSGKA